MKKTLTQIAMFFILVFFLPNSVSAQWWNLYGPGSLEETIEAANGDLVAGGSYRNAVTGLSEGLVLRTDAEGNELWRLTFPNTEFNGSISRVAETGDGDILVTYNNFPSIGIGLTTLYKINSDGTIIWERPMEEINEFQMGSLLEHPETEEIVVSAGNGLDDSSLDSLHAKIILLDESGEINFQIEYKLVHLPISNFFVPIISPISDGYIVALGENAYRLDHSLAEIWSQPINGSRPSDLIETQEGDFACASFNAVDVGSTRAQLFKFDLTGTMIWDTSFFIVQANFLKLIEKPDGEINIIYNHFSNFQGVTQFGDKETSRRTLSVSGELGPEEALPINVQNASDVTQTDNRDLVFMGQNIAFPANINTVFLLRTDCEISSFNNILSGHIYVDENFDCQYDSTEQLLLNYPIQIIHNSGLSYYGTSDNQGYYAVNLASGSYQISAIPQSQYEIPCTPEIVTFNISDTTILQDLPIQRIIECPQMTVSIGTPFLRRCFENTYTVQYCNSGTDDATDATLEIELDPFTIFESSSLPPTSQTDSLLIFDLGDVPIGLCDVFTITTTLSCDAELGQNHCVSAHIYPDSICLTSSPEWDGSSIQVSAQCTEDSVRFFINNLGTGDMLAPLEYIVIQDEILFIQNDFQLNSGQSIQRAYPANGSTYRLEAEQAIGHPGNSMPSATVEGCGEWPFATGFFGYFPQNDNDPFVDIDCQPNIGSYDPNDKSAFPIGYGEQQRIDPNTFVEYKIRFQNTGTDTAFNVSIRDTLSTLLDITTLRIGASSHSYNWRLEDRGTLIFDFPNILLPDSTTNLVESNGFVSFKIGMKPDLTLPQFWLKNKAAIYFDFNEPIIINEVRHSIDTSFVDILVSTKTINPINNRVKIAPNPVHDRTTLSFPEDSEFPLTLKLYSQDGRLIRTEMMNSLTESLEVSNLTPGIYYYGIYEEQGLWASGKLVVQ